MHLPVAVIEASQQAGLDGYVGISHLVSLNNAFHENMFVLNI